MHYHSVDLYIKIAVHNYILVKKTEIAGDTPVNKRVIRVSHEICLLGVQHSRLNLK